jgi:hypothetical protein
VERFRESRVLGRFPVSPGRDSESRDITREPLVWRPVAGLDPLHGYSKRCRWAHLLSALAVVEGQTVPHSTTHRDCCGLKDGSGDSLALLTLGAE